MKHLFLLLCAAALLTVGHAQKSRNPFVGRWDIVATPTQGDPYPHWMEITEKDGALDVYFQPRGGGSKHIAAKSDASHLTFSIAAGRSGAADTTWDLTAAGDKLSGSQKRGDTVQAKLAAVRAPKLDRPMPKATHCGSRVRLDCSQPVAAAMISANRGPHDASGPDGGSPVRNFFLQSVGSGTSRS